MMEHGWLGTKQINKINKSSKTTMKVLKQSNQILKKKAKIVIQIVAIKIKMDQVVGVTVNKS